MKWFSRLFADVSIQISGGDVRVIKGKVSPQKMGELKLLCHDLLLKRGEVWVDKIGKISFSDEIDERHHQKFRNVMNL
jgi:ABC-type hemin transport system ATPase subunit